ncbi:transcriptional regulator, AsnC family [Desulforamulus reducens MI-1]|uniref:siroheme decarboxylase n=1 Tax=Desulforamulus reducens (strain ATCC BAA-1160 / DSM 100696 / MI-1) TaxID=349161 RepID=A4J6H1_DESRM|nr:Lrp/AsnC family transcriptional regulator [Desulforamulus reducens]ABO50674.1 transcriptional regulator, AsnC family [Desulforamulus reducens MI-1]
MTLTDLDKKIVIELQAGLPLVSRPFETLARKLDITEEELITRVHAIQQAGIMRRIGAALRHHRVGFKANAMIVWQISEDKILEVGEQMAKLPEVTHCYQRAALPQWPYNFYTMVHGQSREECQNIAVRLSEIAGVTNYRLLYSVTELKKSSMKYFMD